MFELLQEDAKKRRSALESPQHEPEEETGEERIFVCARCETEIASRRWLFAMRAASYVQVFPNPYGHMKVIYTFRDAEALRVTGTPTTEFTWFEGYTWRIAYCAACNRHLGWLFEALGASEPLQFYGLLKDELAEVGRPTES
jgi:cereblon